MFLRWVVIALVVFVALSSGKKKKDFTRLREPGPLDMTLDERIINAMTDSRAGDFIQSNNTLLVELDIILTPDDWKCKHGKGRSSYAAVRQNLWPQGEIPYEPIGHEFNTNEKKKIQSAFDEFERYTCLKFRPATRSDRHKIYFYTGQGCSSMVGTYGDRQGVSLAKGCRNHGVIVHELAHAIGLNHEQTRPDRDEHVTIVKSNIDHDMLYNFDKYDKYKIDSKNIPYDYLSIMHYGATAFALDYSRPTIRTHDPAFQSKIGQRNGLSYEDVQVINLMYNCGGRCNKRCPIGFVGKDCECYCKQERTSRNARPAIKCGTGGGGVITESGKPEPCEDKNDDCAAYYDAGICDKPQYKQFIDQNCRKSCRLCSGGGGGGGGDGGDGGGGTVIEGECKDLVACNGYKITGICDKEEFKHYVEKNCRKSCGFCTEIIGGGGGGGSGGGGGWIITGTGGGGGGSGSCEDVEVEQCPAWKSVGSCEDPKYLAYMEINCKQTCGFCSGGGGGGGQAACHDSDGRCAEWARSGVCDISRTIRNNLCPLSCKAEHCRGARAHDDTCFDENYLCPDWAEAGFCEAPKHQAHLRRVCRRSCNICGRQAPADPRPVCMDISRSCPKFRKDDGCLKNPHWMNQFCKKTCKACGGAWRSARCKDANPDCSAWAERGMCQENEGYMRDNCPEACGLC